MSNQPGLRKQVQRRCDMTGGKDLEPMPFHLLAKETVEDGIKRIVSEEIARAIKDIDNRRLKRTEAIHEVQKAARKSGRCCVSYGRNSKKPISLKMPGFAIRRRGSPRSETPKP